jgi:hypothetical protein
LVGLKLKFNRSWRLYSWAWWSALCREGDATLRLQPGKYDFFLFYLFYLYFFLLQSRSCVEAKVCNWSWLEFCFNGPAYEYCLAPDKPLPTNCLQVLRYRGPLVNKYLRMKPLKVVSVDKIAVFLLLFMLKRFC